MKKTKLASVCTSFILAIVCLFTGVFCNISNDNTTTDNTALAVRDLNVNEIGSLSCEEKVQEILEEFDVYEYDFNETTIEFNGTFTKDLSAFDGFQYLNTLNDSEITTTYSTKLNCEKGTISVLVTSTQNGEIIEQIEEEAIPVYDEKVDDYFITLKDGTQISVINTLDLDNLTPCIAIVDDIAIATIFVVGLVVVVAAPIIVETVKTVSTTIVTWVKSFWSWLRGVFKKTTVTTTVVTQTITYPVTINGTQYLLEAYSEKRKFESKLYYLALADTDDGLLYVSTKPIPKEEAIAVLTASSLTQESAHGSKKQFTISLYTPTEALAYDITYSAGELLGYPGNTPHPARKPGYFNHYHPGSEYHNPHCFYGLPKKD